MTRIMEILYEDNHLIAVNKAPGEIAEQAGELQIAPESEAHELDQVGQGVHVGLHVQFVHVAGFVQHLVILPDLIYAVLMAAKGTL